MSVTPLAISKAELEALAALRERAAAAPVDMRELPDCLHTPDGKAAHMAQMTEQTIALPLAFLVTFSIETHHPVGTCRHMSMSVQREGRLPNPHAVWMVAAELGFVGGFDACTVWIEELKGHGQSVNVLQPVAVTAVTEPSR